MSESVSNGFGSGDPRIRRHPPGGRKSRARRMRNCLLVYTCRSSGRVGKSPSSVGETTAAAVATTDRVTDVARGRRWRRSGERARPRRRRRRHRWAGGAACPTSACCSRTAVAASLNRPVCSDTRATPAKGHETEKPRTKRKTRNKTA